MGRASTAVAVLLVACVGAVAAAPTTGQINGRVTDTEGKAIENVTVTLVGATTTGRPTTTDERGEFRFYHLDPGHYTVWADENGPRVAWRGVGVRAGTSSRVTITLRTSEQDESDLFAPELEGGQCEDASPPHAAKSAPALCLSSARS